MSPLTSKLAAGAAIAAAAVGGATIANAASSSGTSSSSAAPAASAPGLGTPPKGGMVGGRHSLGGRTEKALTGTVAAKVRAAALAKVPGTVERVETNVDGSAPYEAHIAKSDGTSVEVQVSKDFQVVATNAMGQRP